MGLLELLTDKFLDKYQREDKLAQKFLGPAKVFGAFVDASSQSPEADADMAARQERQRKLRAQAAQEEFFNIRAGIDPTSVFGMPPLDMNKSIPQRLNNPGNLKRGGLGDQFAMKDPQGKVWSDEFGHLRFKDDASGRQAILADLEAKLTGNTAHFKTLGSDPTIAALNDVWAEDPNWKNNVSFWLGKLTNNKVDVNAPVKGFDRQTLLEAIGRAEGYWK